jgi:subtilisin family serine protease
MEICNAKEPYMRDIRPLIVILSVMLSLLIHLQASAASHIPPHVPGELLVQFKSATEQHQKNQLAQRAGTKTIRKVGQGRIHVVVVDAALSLEQARRIYADHPEVVSVEPNYILGAQQQPKDMDFDLQWALHNSGQIVAGYVGTPGADMDALNAWSIATGSHDIVVAVVDTGCNLTHPDQAANLWTNSKEIPGNGVDDDGNGYIDDYHGWDFRDGDNDPADVSGHGTHVAGIIAAQGNNQIGIAGMSWKARIMPVRFMGAFDQGTTADAIAAIEYAVAQGAQIINCSWGGGGYSTALRNTMVNSGVLFVCAAGNVASDNDSSPFYPASFAADNIIAVAASDQMDRLTWFSNFGTRSVDIAAPGIRIYSLDNSHRVIWQSDFDDSMLTDWTTGGYPDTWTVVDPPYVNDSPALATNTGGDYANQSDMWVRSAAIDLSDASASTLDLKMVGVSQSSADKLLIEISDDAVTWSTCPLQAGGGTVESGISGTVPYWMPVKVDLGSLDGKPQAYIRLRFVSDAMESQSGFYIDNLSLTAAASDETYCFMQGTSMAAGFVSGLAALLLSQKPELPPSQIKSIIESSVDLNQALEDRVLSGGRVNAFNALTLIQELFLTANAATGDGIQLSWSVPSDAHIDAQATIERRTDDQAQFTPLALVDTGDGSHVDSDVAADITYYYRIHAATADGASGYSNQSSATAATVSIDSGGGSSGGGCFIAVGAVGGE